MEQRIPQSLPQTELRAKTQRQKQRANSLKKQGRFQDKTRHADDPAYLGRRNGLLHNPALFQADFSTRKHKNRYRHSDHSHAADLNQQQRTTCPKGAQYRAVSWITSPVTQVADVAVNSASRNGAPPGLLVAQGSISSSVPPRIKKKAQKNSLRRRNPDAFEKKDMTSLPLVRGRMFTLAAKGNFREFQNQNYCTTSQMRIPLRNHLSY